MNGLKKYINKLPRLEFLLPLIYFFIATGILLYQYLVPDYIEGYDVMTGAVNIRSSWLLFFLIQTPVYVILYPIWYIFGFNIFQTNIFVNKLLFSVKLDEKYGFYFNISFVLVPICYYIIGLLIRKYFEKEKKFQKKKPNGNQYN